MKYKAIIFDMDGTIIEVENIWDKATFHLFESRGIEVTQEIKDEIGTRLHGLAINQSCKIIKDIGNMSDSIEHLMKQKSDFACNLYGKTVHYMDGFLRFHQMIVNDHNLKVGVATNADTQTVQVTNKKLNLEKLFGRHVYNLADVGFVGKPNPDVYLHAAEQLEIDPEYCVAIEDSPHGIDAAKGAGMFCIGINSAKDRERISHANFVIDHYDEIDVARLLKRKKNQ